MNHPIDVTTPLHSGSPVFPGDPPVRINYPDGDNAGVRISRLSMGSHSGTHIDSPSHCIPGGATLDRINPGRFLGMALVLDLTGLRAIDAPDLLAKWPNSNPPSRSFWDQRYNHETGDIREPQIKQATPGRARGFVWAEKINRQWDGEPGAKILLRTDNSARGIMHRPFDQDYVGLTAAAAELLTHRCAGLVGIDGPSVDLPGISNLPAHHILLGAEILILEGLDLQKAPPGRYWMVALPFLFKDSDAAPARVLLYPEGCPC